MEWLLGHIVQNPIHIDQKVFSKRSFTGFESNNGETKVDNATDKSNFCQ